MSGNEQDNFAQHKARNNAREQRIARIAQLNDECRTGRADHLLTITPGVRCMGAEAMVAVVGQVRSYANFSSDSDPYGERDFGTIEVGAQRLFWKIDYYDKQLEYGSPDPADPFVTQRVLTIMLASEY
jgi:hypothetical protein